MSNTARITIPTFPCASLPTTRASATFLISDGVLPSNEGRGYVLRLIMRRALYHGQTLGLTEPFLYKISSRVVDMMKDAYPELVQTAPHIARAIKIEEERYALTTRLGLERLDGVLLGGQISFGEYRSRRHSRSVSGSRSTYTIGGADLFQLHDTFGLRPDFVEDIVKPYGLTVDRVGYEAEMQKQRERARASWKGAEKKVAAPVFLKLAEGGRTVFDGYTQTTSTDCRIVALIQKGEPLEEVKAGSEVEIVLDHTPFYAEAGGQVGDTGHFLAPATDHEVAHITNTYYPVSGLIVHKAEARDALRVGDLVTAVVDSERRDRDAAQSFRHPSAARGAAQDAGDAREAGGVAGGAGPVAL